MSKSTGEKDAVQRRKLIERYLQHRDQGREHYVEADKLLKQLRAEGMKLGDKVVISGNREAKLIDNFADDSAFYKTIRIEQFGIETRFTN